MNKYTKLLVKDIQNNYEEKERLLNILKSALTKLRPSTKSKNIDSFATKGAIPMISRLNPKTKYNGIPKPQRAMTAKYRPNLARKRQSSRPTTVNSKSSRINFISGLSSKNMSNISSNVILAMQMTKNNSMQDLK